MSDVDHLATVLREADELAYDNIHADWARESIARTILASAWLAERDGTNRLRGALNGALDAVAAEREDLAAKLRIEHQITFAVIWGIGAWVPVCQRCRHGDSFSRIPARWPCATLQLLGWPEPPELVAGDMRHAVDHIRYHAVPPQVTP